MRDLEARNLRSLRPLADKCWGSGRRSLTLKDPGQVMLGVGWRRASEDIDAQSQNFGARRGISPNP